MKYLQQLILILIISILGLSSLNAQDIDRERMQRDLNIMENVLEELFKSEWSSETEIGSGTLTSINYHDGMSWTSNKSSTVEGSYFSDYGTIFMITGSRPITLKLKTDGDATGYFSSAGGNKSERIKINRESIINRISEFLMDYGFTIKQLAPKENVTVVYKSNNIDQLFTILRNDSLNKKVDTSSKLSISVSASMRDLQTYRKGNIDNSTLSKRLRISDINSEGDSERKLRIMSKILQTSFEDEQSDNFEIANGQHFYLDGFGAIFEVEASYGSGLYGLDMAYQKVAKLKEIAQSDSSLSISFSDDDFSWSSDEDSGEEKTPEQIKEAYNNFIKTLKEILVDYGQTLSSLQSDENILISLSISAAGDFVPERLDLRTKKLVLETLHSGEMSREEAMEQIKVQEY